METIRTVLQTLASEIERYKRVSSKPPSFWTPEHTKAILDDCEDNFKAIEDNCLPSGSGIDNGTRIDIERSTAEKIVLHFGYHHMDDNGYYAGWTEHTITIRPSFTGVDMKISGRNRNDIKEYLYQTFDQCLNDPGTVHQYIWSVKFPVEDYAI